MTAAEARTSDQQAESEQRVTALELFFDLVFVFAITQVTGFLAAHSTWDGLLQGMFILGALWWAWAAYAWLTNTLNPEEGIVRIAVFASMAAMLIVALAAPNAFGADGLVFGVAYFIVRALHLVLYAHRRPRRSRADAGGPPDRAERPHRRGAARGGGLHR